MDDPSQQVIGTQASPHILGTDDGLTSPVFVLSEAYANGLRYHQFGWVVGDEVESALQRGEIILVVEADGPEPVPTFRPPDYVPELGIQTRFGTEADVTAFTAEQSNDPAGAREAATPASIHDDQSDRRPYQRRRDTADSTADSRAVADSNDDSARFTRDPNVEQAPDEGTYDLDAPTPAPRRGRPRTADR